MLVFARGKGPGERVRIADLFRAVHDAMLAVKPPDAHLIIEGDDALVELDGNRTALTAALTNLINNAFESGAGRRRHARGAQTRGERVELTVHDNGPGIAPSIQSRVFEPFFSTRARRHGPRARGRQDRGRGARRRCSRSSRRRVAVRGSSSICRAARGRRRRSRGDRFRVRRKRGRLSMEPATILVVEDDRPLQDALVSTLVTAGYKVLAAADGGEALKVLARRGGRSRRERRADAARRRVASCCGACSRDSRHRRFC